MKTGNFTLRKFQLATALTISLLGAVAIMFAQTAPKRHNADARPAPVSEPDARQIQLDLDKAAAFNLPDAKNDLTAVSFKTPDGKEGWMMRIPGSRPIATPAYANGMIFVGGGYGSHEFYAIDAETGRVVWQMQTDDDGPTAAVVEDGFVAFNTESCTVIVAEAKTGKVVWQEWLGDPLMSQPAISQGKLYIAYPAGQRGAQQVQNNSTQPDSTNLGPGHRLLCADLKTGRHLWEQKITADVISAPVISGDQVLFTCFDGVSFCLNASTGAIVWKKENAGTSAPLVADGQVVTTSKEMKDGKAYEGLKRLELKGGEERDREMLAREKADYLKEDKGGGVAFKPSQGQALDSSVGFGSAPSAAKLNEANQHIGVSTVAGAWAYQGSRAAYSNGQMMNAQGKFLNSIKASDGNFAWRAEVKGKGIEEDTQVFSPPALGKRNLYLCGAQGHIVAINQKDGALAFAYALKQPMAFQPALAKGNIYAGTVNGLLICLKTGDKDADEWYAWGGNAQHNK
jgi:Ca-activated chloride channel family protein